MANERIEFDSGAEQGQRGLSSRNRVDGKNEGKKDVDNIAKDVDNTVKNVDNIESGVDNVQNGNYMDTLFMEFPKKDKDKKGGENA